LFLVAKNKSQPLSTANGQRPRWATTKQTADHLAVTGRTVRQMTADGRLVRYTLGPRIIRYDLNEVDAAMAECREPNSFSPFDDQKVCPRCGLAKPLTEFGADRRASDGAKSQCKRCEADEARERYAERRA
jgi:hypothetical protein